MDSGKPKKTEHDDSNNSVLSHQNYFNRPTLKSVQLLFLAAFLLLVTLGSFSQAWHFEYGMIITQLFVILAPALFFLRRFLPAKDLKRRLVPLKAKYLPAIFINAVSFWVINMVLATVLVYALMEAGFEPAVAIAPPQTVAQYLNYLIVLVIFTGICEEVLFRGTIMPALESHGLSAATFYSALLFALMHVSFLNLAGTFILGIVMAVIAIKTGSLWGSILFHMLNNFIAITYLYLAGQHEAASQASPTDLLVLAPLLFLGLVGAWFGLRLLHKQSGSEPVFKKKERLVPKGWLSWPVIIAIILFLTFVMLELALGFKWFNINLG